MFNVEIIYDVIFKNLKNRILALLFCLFTLCMHTYNGPIGHGLVMI